MKSEENIQKILENQVNIRLDIASIKVDLRHHIKRSDKHETVIQKLWFAIALLAGAGLGTSGPSIIKYLGSIL